MEEHIHISALTRVPMNGLQVYAPLQHVKISNDCAETNISRESFKIIGRHTNEYII